MMAKVHSDFVQSDGGVVLESIVEDESGRNSDCHGEEPPIRSDLLFLVFLFPSALFFADLNARKKI